MFFSDTLQNACQMILSLNNVFSTLFVKFLCKKTQKVFKFGQIRKYTNFLEKKSFSEKASLAKLEGGKYVGGSRMFSFIIKSEAIFTDSCKWQLWSQYCWNYKIIITTFCVCHFHRLRMHDSKSRSIQKFSCFTEKYFGKVEIAKFMFSFVKFSLYLERQCFSSEYNIKDYESATFTRLTFLEMKKLVVVFSPQFSVLRKLITVEVSCVHVNNSP